MADPLITQEFVDGLAQRAQEAERLRSLPPETLADLRTSGLTDLLVPKAFGGMQSPFPDILDPVRQLAHGCVASAWTIGFYVLHNWMLALFDERAQEEGFGDRPFLSPAPLAPTGRGVPADGGVRLSGRWSWATGVMHGNWVMVGALCGPDEDIRPASGLPASFYPALALLPAADVEIVDTWHTDGMRATGSNDVIATDVFVPEHRLVRVADIYTGTAPGAGLHDAATYRWPLVPALSLVAAMPALGGAEKVVELYTSRMSERILLYEGGKAQRDKPIAQARLAQARVRLRALRSLRDDVVEQIESAVASGEEVSLAIRGDARMAAAHIVRESREVINLLLEASGASVHFLSHPIQRIKRDVDVLSGHVVFDYDAIGELDGALALGMSIPSRAMV